jgi:chromosome segregation ATPase
MSDCEHPKLRTGDTFDQLRVVEPCLFCERNRLTAENAALRDDHERACGLVAEMHAAAVGEVRGPTLGVVEDIAALRSRLAEAELNVAEVPTLCRRYEARLADLEAERALLVTRAENAEAALVEAEQEYQDARTVRKQLEARLADTEQQRDDALALLTKISLRKSCEGTQPYICHGLATARSWLAAADALLKEARDEINHLSGYAEDETDGKSGLTTWPLLDRIDAHLAREAKP